MKKIIDLYPEAPNEWLWRDNAEDVKREFYPSVSIPAQDEPLWHECTDEEKTAYEAEWSTKHPEEFIEESTEVAEDEMKAKEDAQV